MTPITRPGRHPDPIFCFTHVQKAGGTTVEAVFRRNFGLRHMIVDPPRGWIYRERDLRADLRLNPFLRNACGHWLRPFVRFGALEKRLVWYTILRRPVERYISHYRHHVEKMGSSQSFEQFLEQPIQRNWQTQLIAGEQDVEAAKQILAERYRAVALLERFDESLVLLRERLGLPWMKLSYGRPHNAGDRRSGTEDPVRSAADRERDRILENNELDLELYDFAERVVYARQVGEYGAARLAADVESEFSEYRPGLPDRLRERGNAAFRRAVYLPVVRRRRARAVEMGEPDIRR